MKNIFATCLLLISFFCWGHCPKELGGTWIGSYTDHGPYDATIPIALKFDIHGNKFSGHTVDTETSIGLHHMILQGACKKNAIQFYLSSGQIDPKPQASIVHFKDHDKITIDLHWQNAMIGGFGPAIVEKKKSL